MTQSSEELNRLWDFPRRRIDGRMEGDSGGSLKGRGGKQEGSYGEESSWFTMRRHKIKQDFITLFISTMTYAINRSLSALFLECLGRNVRCSPKPLVTAADPLKQLLDFLFPNVCFEHIQV